MRNAHGSATQPFCANQAQAADNLRMRSATTPTLLQAQRRVALQSLRNSREMPFESDRCEDACLTFSPPIWGFAPVRLCAQQPCNAQKHYNADISIECRNLKLVDDT